MEQWDPLANLFIAIMFLVAIPFVMRAMVPGAYRFAERLLSNIGRFTFKHLWKIQNDRRGWLHALWNTCIVFAVLTTYGVTQGLSPAVPIALWFFVVLIKKVINHLKIIQRKKYAMPGRRRR